VPRAVRWTVEQAGIEAHRGLFRRHDYNVEVSIDVSEVAFIT
jgi:hypothetical protein